MSHRRLLRAPLRVSIREVHELLDGLTVDMATMVPGHMLSKLKSATRDVKLLKGYSATVHGVDLILNRLPQKTLKEKAVLVRETLSII